MALVSLSEAFGAPQGPAPAPSAAPSWSWATPPPVPSGFTPLDETFGAPSPQTSQPQPQATGAPATQQPRPTTQSQPSVPTPPGQDALTTASQANSLLQQGAKLFPDSNNVGGSGVGIGDITGPLSLATGLDRGNATQALGGGLATLGSGVRLLSNNPSLNFTGLDAGELGGVGGAIQGVGGLLGVATGVQDLLHGNVGSGVKSLVPGAISAYGGAATLANAIAPGTLPTVSELLGQGLSALGNLFGSAAGETGAVAGEAAAAGGEAAAAAGAETAATAASGATSALVAAPLAAIVLAQQISGMLDSQHAAYGAAENFRKLTGDLPQSIQSIRNLPAAIKTMPTDGTATAQQALDSIAAVKKIIDPWMDSGLYDFVQSGETSAGGGSSGNSATIRFPQGPEIARTIWQPAINAAEQHYINAMDVLQKHGVDPATAIPDFRWNMMSPYAAGLATLEAQVPNLQLVPPPDAVTGADPWNHPPDGYSYFGGRFIRTDVMNDLLALQGGGPADPTDPQSLSRSFASPKMPPGGLRNGINALIQKFRNGGYPNLHSANGSNVVATARAQQYDSSIPATQTQIAQQYQGAPATQAQIQEQYQVASTPDGGGGG